MVAALFERTTRRVNLTPAGLALFTEARRVLAAAKVARSVVAEMQSLQRGRLMIGAIQGLSPFIDLPTPHGTRQLVDQSFAAAGLSRRSEVGVDDLTMQLDLVAHGLGVTLVPELVAQSRMLAASDLPLSHASLAELEPCWALAVVYQKQLDTAHPSNAAAGACLAFLR